MTQFAPVSLVSLALGLFAGPVSAQVVRMEITTSALPKAEEMLTYVLLSDDRQSDDPYFDEWLRLISSALDLAGYVPAASVEVADLGISADFLVTSPFVLERDVLTSYESIVGYRSPQVTVTRSGPRSSTNQTGGVTTTTTVSVEVSEPEPITVRRYRSASQSAIVGGSFLEIVAYDWQARQDTGRATVVWETAASGFSGEMEPTVIIPLMLAGMQKYFGQNHEKPRKSRIHGNMRTVRYLLGIDDRPHD